MLRSKQVTVNVIPVINESQDGVSEYQSLTYRFQAAVKCLHCIQALLVCLPWHYLLYISMFPFLKQGR